MTSEDKRVDRLDILAGALRDGYLSDTECGELAELLKTLPGAHRRLAEHMVMASLLEQELKELASENLWQRNRAAQFPASGWPRFFFPIVAALALVFLLVYARNREDTAKRIPSSRKILPGEQLDTGVAVMTEALGATCEQAGRSVVVGTSIRQGLLRLKTGVIRIEFYSGASIILEGAAELKVQSASEATLLSGKLLARVPPHARGFIIHSPMVDLVDKGTEFGVSVNDEDGTRVHVFAGKVDVLPDSNRAPGTTKKMLAGAGLHIDPNGTQSVFTADAGQFVTPQALRARVSANLEQRSSQWKNLSANVRQDPRVIAYYPFERDLENDRKLKNASKQGEFMAGSIVGATWAGGRWPGKEALEFKRPGDRVRITVPGRHSAITLLAWTRIDGFDNIYNSLVLSDGWGRSGAMHWEFLTGGQLELSVSARPGLDYDFRTSQRNLHPYDLGRWVLLAAVYDAVRRSAVHYIDGAVVERLSLTEALPIEIGQAHIGNWTPAGYEDATPIRNLNGRIDELIIFDQALSPQEILHFFQIGRPQF